jgi:DNA polymerase-3 subunit alpha
MEKEALGFYITGHPLNEYKDKLAELSVIATTELQELNDKQEVIIGGIVRDSKQIQTKKGDLMGYITIEDMYGNVEVIVFPDIYKDAQNTISRDNPLVISGYTDKTDKGMKIIARKIASIDDNELIEGLKSADKSSSKNNGSKKTKTNGLSESSDTGYKSLVLTMYNNNTKPETLPKLEEILLKYTGNCPVYLKIISPNQWETILLTECHVMPSKDMILEVEELLGEKTAILN